MVRGESPGPAPATAMHRASNWRLTRSSCGRGTPELRRKVSGPDGALTAQPRTPDVPPARSAWSSCSRRQLARRLVSILSPLWPALAESNGRPAGPGPGRVAGRSQYGRDCSVAASIGCSFRAGFCSKPLSPDSKEHPPAASRAVPKAVHRFTLALV